MPGLLDADQTRGQYRAHWPRIDPAVGVTADRGIDRTVIETCRAANTTQHVLKFPTDQGAPAIVEQHDMILLGAVEITRPARSGRDRRIRREFLTGRRTRQQAQQGRGILEGRDQLLDAGHNDVDARQDLRQVAVALVGYDNARAGLGDEEIGSGDPDISGEKLRSQHRARFVAHLARLVERPSGIERTMFGAECFGDLFFDQVDCRRNDMTWGFLAQLNDVFAEVGFNRGNAVRLEVFVEPHLLGDHRLALGDRLGAGRTADLQNSSARLFRRARPMNLTARGFYFTFVILQIEVEMLDRMVLDRSADFTKSLELGQALDREAPAQRKASARKSQCPLQILVGKRAAGASLKVAAGGEHRCYRDTPIAGTSSVMPESTSAM